MHYNPTKPTLLTTEATDSAMSAKLTHVEGINKYPIFYARKTLDTTQQNYDRADKECPAVNWATYMFKTTLSDKEFILETDKRALKELLRDNTAKVRRAR